MTSFALRGPLATREVSSNTKWPLPEDTGRRLRALALMIRQRQLGNSYELLAGSVHLATCDAKANYGAALQLLDKHPYFSDLHLRSGDDACIVSDISQVYPPAGRGYNPSLPEALQDLSDEIFVDMHEACFAFDDPDLYYPGVDEGIVPVSDEHIRLVIPAMERELTREERPPAGMLDTYGQRSLPYAPLHELPWHVQRALVERRRLRYQQWGITQEVWRRGKWSLWEVPEDAEWTPRWPPATARM